MLLFYMQSIIIKRAKKKTTFLNIMKANREHEKDDYKILNEIILVEKSSFLYRLLFCKQNSDPVDLYCISKLYYRNG